MPLMHSQRARCRALAALVLGGTILSVRGASTVILSYNAGSSGIPAVAPAPESVQGGSWILFAPVANTNLLSEGLSPDPLYNGLNAWRILDNDTGAGLRYERIPNAQQLTNAMWCGWKASARLRVEDPVANNGGTIAIFFQFGSTNQIMNRRYLMFADIQADDGLYVSAGATTVQVTNNPAAYHLYEITYDSATRSAQLRVDGVTVHTNWPALSIPAAVDGCLWGSGSSGGRGDGYFNLVQVEVNDPGPAAVTLHPVSVSTNVGGTATFTADFAGCATNLQWYKNGAPIPGANQRSYTDALVVRSDAGEYWLGIADPMTGQEVTTAKAVLTVDAPMAGVTILVHGLVLQDGNRKEPFEYWGSGANIAALLRRFQSGLAWLYDPETGNYDNITHSSAHPIPTSGWIPDYEGEQVLLFDWSDASDEQEAGQAEAAADALFASLMRFEINEQRMITSSPYRAVRPLHFIGHSRGTVVVSETVQRLGRFNIPVSYVTYLDPHDYGHEDILRDQYFHDPAVQVWHNVAYADAAFQTNAPLLCAQNPGGRALTHLSNPAQTNITALTAAADCPYASPHGWVKDYYWATVALNAGTHPHRPASWFDDGNGANHGFDRWFRRGGYAQPRDPTIQRTRSVDASHATPFVRNPPDERDYQDRNDVPPVLFNGDFDLPDLDRGIGSAEANSLAGWRYFGGGGNAHVRPLMPTPIPPGATIPDTFIALHDGALIARHNRFFLPTGAREIRFAISIPYVPLNGTHELEVRIGNRVVRRFTLNENADFEARTVDLTNDPDLLGGVNTLTFELLTVPSIITLLTARIHLDDINIVTNPTGWIDSISRNPDQSWRIEWQCWPASTFYLKASTNLTAGSWPTVATSSPAETAGIFNVPDTGQSAIWFRGLIDPAR